MDQSNTEEQTKQIALLEAYSLKGLFIQLSHDLDGCWNKAQKIKDFSARLEAFREIFKAQDKVIDSIRATVNAIRRHNEKI